MAEILQFSNLSQFTEQLCPMHLSITTKKKSQRHAQLTLKFFFMTIRRNGKQKSSHKNTINVTFNMCECVCYFLLHKALISRNDSLY